MKRKKRKIIVCLGIVFFILFILFAVLYILGWGTNYETIEDMAYDKTGRSDCVVYLKENDKYEPYLVLDSDYNGNVLLLRKYLLDETRQYKENENVGWQWGEFASYYPESSIDDFLNEEFISTLEQSVQEVIVESEIEVTDKSSYGSQDRNSLTITRKAFLLSVEELGYDSEELYTKAKEGDNLKYFTDNYRRRKATWSNGKIGPYWTRTPHLWDTCMVTSIRDDVRGHGAADVYSGVRPAFCIEKGTAVEKKSGIKRIKKIYVIE